jgi:hypothetical protein
MLLVPVLIWSELGETVSAEELRFRIITLQVLLGGDDGRARVRELPFIVISFPESPATAV